MTSLVHQLTIAHKRWDTRIWVKQVATLRDAGLLSAYEVADGDGDAVSDGVTIRDLGESDGRGFWPRVRLVLRATRLNGSRRGEVVHFHDPLFLPGAIWLKLKGRRIVYDVHEDYPRQVLNWLLPSYIRYGASTTYTFLEWVAGWLFDGIVAATPKIAERFPEGKTVVVQNFPILEELVVRDTLPYADRPPNFVYVGGISSIRGAKEMVQAISKVPDYYRATLQLAGSFSPDSLVKELHQLPGWGNTKYLGWVTRPQVASLLGAARAGLVLFHPAPNHIDAQPNKMFEYMAAGLPVIASDFPLWREIVNGAGCGLLVDPLNPTEIAKAMKWMLDHPEEVAAMGCRSRRAVEERYNWDREAEKLLAFYHRLLK